jgi:hypothetical protein
MFKTALIAATAILSLGATPSLAAPVSTAAGALEGAPVAAQTTSAKTTQRSEATRYCVIETPTGSHIQRKTCHTRKDWMDMTGVDPLTVN